MIKLSNRFTDRFLKGRRSSLTIFIFGIPVIEITQTMYHFYFGGSDKEYYRAVKMMSDLHFMRNSRLRNKHLYTPLAIYNKARA